MAHPFFFFIGVLLHLQIPNFIMPGDINDVERIISQDSFYMEICGFFDCGIRN